MFDIPCPVHSDHGVQNVLFSRLTIENRGDEEDELEGLTSFAEMFMKVFFLSCGHFLVIKISQRSGSPLIKFIHIFPFVYKKSINNAMPQFMEGWNHHPVHTMPI